MICAFEIGGWDLRPVCEDGTVVDLRKQIAKRVDDVSLTRREREAAPGRFSQFETRKDIRFITTGRTTGLPRAKWWLPFAPDGDVLYLLEERGRQADWVQNAIATGHVVVEGLHASARVVRDPAEEARARQLCRERFDRVGLALQDLVESGLVVAFDADAAG